jgi:hypothetical protein
MDRTRRRPLRYRGVHVPRLPIAVVLSAIALYLDAGIPLVAFRAQRHFSAMAWSIIVCLAIAASWAALHLWHELTTDRRKPTN